MSTVSVPPHVQQYKPLPTAAQLDLGVERILRPIYGPARSSQPKAWVDPHEKLKPFFTAASDGGPIGQAFVAGIGYQ